MKSYCGKIYDLDFIQANDWCQALIRNPDDEQNIVVVTSDIRMQSVLETAMTMSQEIEVSYEGENPSKLTRAKLNIPFPHVTAQEASG